MNPTEVVAQAAIRYLSDNVCFSRDCLRTSRDMVQAIRRMIDNGDINLDLNDGTILNYISRAAANGTRGIISVPGRNGGYYYRRTEEENVGGPEPPPEPEDINVGETETPVYEKDLYPLVTLWLQKRGYTAKDTSALRAGGRWGNPDVMGADRVELLGAIEIELVSFEVKLNESNWEKFIFEAISHKRVVNRSWFCYRVAEEGQPLPPGIEYYAERYRVGIVQIELNDTELVQLKQGVLRPLDMLERVIERVPALYDYVPLREQSALIGRSGIINTISFSI